MLPEPVIIGVRLRCNADCGGDDNRIAIKRSFRPGVMNSVDRFKVKKLRHAVWRALGRFCETTWFLARWGELWVYCAVIKAEMLSGTSLRSLSWAKILQMARHESGICSLFKPGMGMWRTAKAIVWNSEYIGVLRTFLIALQRFFMYLYRRGVGAMHVFHPFRANSQRRG